MAHRSLVIGAGIWMVVTCPAQARATSGEFRRPLNTPEAYLRDVAVGALQQRGLVGKSAPPLAYAPMGRASIYHKMRRQLMRPLPKLGKVGMALGFVALTLAPKLANMSPKVGAYVMLFSALAAAAPAADRLLFHGAADLGLRTFRDTYRPPGQARSGLTITDPKDLDAHATMLDSSAHVLKSFPSLDDHRLLGITLGAVADQLSAATRGSKLARKLGLTDARRIALLTQQRVPWESAAEAIQELFTGRTPRQVAKLLRSDGASVGSSELRKGLAVIEAHLEGQEVVLRVQEAPARASASQLSQGSVRIAGNAGNNLASYAGAHSQDTDCPRVVVEGSTGNSTGTRAKRGVITVSGNAGPRLAHDATGGVFLVGGKAGGQCALGMSDRTWPAIVVAVGGLEYNLHGVRDGLLISLDDSTQKGNRMAGAASSAAAYRFESGEMHRQPLEGNVLEAAGHLIEAYVSKWEPRQANGLMTGRQPIAHR